MFGPGVRRSLQPAGLLRRRLRSAACGWRDAAAYLPAQVAGCAGGAVIANLMFSRAAVSISAKDRGSAAHFLSEVVATLGLRPGHLPRWPGHGRSTDRPGGSGRLHRCGVLLHRPRPASPTRPSPPAGTSSATFAGIAPASAPAFIARPGHRRRPGRRADPRHRTPGVTAAEAAECMSSRTSCPAQVCPRARRIRRCPRVLFVCVHNAGLFPDGRRPARPRGPAGASG